MSFERRKVQAHLDAAREGDATAAAVLHLELPDGTPVTIATSDDEWWDELRGLAETAALMATDPAGVVDLGGGHVDLHLGGSTTRLIDPHVGGDGAVAAARTIADAYNRFELSDRPTLDEASGGAA